MNPQGKQSVFEYLKTLRNRDIFLESDSSLDFSDECLSENETNPGNDNSGKKTTSNDDDDYFKSTSYDYFRNFKGSSRFSFNPHDIEDTKLKVPNPAQERKIIYSSKNTYSASDFEHLDVLGSGAYAEVVKVRHKKTLEIFAMKIIDKILLDKEEKLFQIFVENEFLNILNHPNIIKIYGTFEEKDQIHLVLEYVPNGTLASYIKKFCKLKFLKYYINSLNISFLFFIIFKVQKSIFLN